MSVGSYFSHCCVVGTFMSRRENKSSLVNSPLPGNLVVQTVIGKSFNFRIKAPAHVKHYSSSTIAKRRLQPFMSSGGDVKLDLNAVKWVCQRAIGDQSFKGNWGRNAAENLGKKQIWATWLYSGVIFRTTTSGCRNTCHPFSEEPLW